MREKVVFKLSAPIRVIGDDVTELRLRVPKGRDVADCGSLSFAIIKGDTFNLGLDTAVGAKYIARCAGIPARSVEEIDGADFIEIVGIIQGFLAKKQSSIDGSTLDISSETSPTS